MVIVTSLEKHKLEGEQNNQFINRLCSLKNDLNLTWKNLATIINDELGFNYDESWYRKNYKAGAFNDPEPVVTTTSTDDCCGNCNYCPEETKNACEAEVAELEYEASLNEKLRQIQLKKIEVSDLVMQNNAYLRRISREQTIKDIAHDYAEIMNKDKILKPCLCPFINLSDKEGILLLSDWHYGMICDNPWNKFDPDICKERVNKLLDKVTNIVKEQKITHVTVLDLADLIAGRIHTQIRIESRFDVITLLQLLR